jgi:hypothetical protein
VKERTAAAQEMLEKYGILIEDYGFMSMEDDLGICIGISERFPKGVFLALVRIGSGHLRPVCQTYLSNLSVKPQFVM